MHSGPGKIVQVECRAEPPQPIGSGSTGSLSVTRGLNVDMPPEPGGQIFETESALLVEAVGEGKCFIGFGRDLPFIEHQ